jgi:hypothetical protein
MLKVMNWFVIDGMENSYGVLCTWMGEEELDNIK